ncbi:MAG: nudix hydrolase [uncultured marine phage]|uniref:Nudix hydrolase n=1 Tax=uncultured marine phage TaxID=707152 RepID=A0A8D9C8V5_9VIRU|nr:MAG: nudix hydrolase [uncultured marine phage]
MKITCGIWLINNRKEILFTHPTYHPEKFHTIPKGLIDKGETEMEAAKRELFEETNISWDQIKEFITNITELTIKPYNHGKKSLKSFVVECDSDLEFLDLKCEFMVTSHKWAPFPEVDGFVWKTLDGSRNDLDLHHTHIMCFKELEDILG